jgi:hypothetical protein
LFALLILVSCIFAAVVVARTTRVDVGGHRIENAERDPGDRLDDHDRAALHTALQASDVDVAAGRLVDASELLRRLRTS